MATHDAGLQIACPGCGQIVAQKAMIPVLGDQGHGLRYLCSSCARGLIVAPSVPETREPAPALGDDGTEAQEAQPSL